MQLVNKFHFRLLNIYSILKQEHVAYFSEKLNAIIETDLYKIRTINIIQAYRYIGRRLRIKSKVK